MPDYDQPASIDLRVRYFDGQFLKDQDFIDEQKYHIDRHRRLAKLLHVSGIAQGLTIGATPTVPDRVTVEPGAAFDLQGRQVVLRQPESVPLKDYRDRTVDLVIVFDQIEALPAGEGEGSQGNRRWQEKPKILVVETNQAAPEGAIALAQLRLDSNGIVTVDRTVRQYSGIALPTAVDGIAPTLRSGGDRQSNLAVLSGSLSISGALTPSAGQTDTNGIVFPKDVGGGSGDAAWMRYYRRGNSGEACTLEIGVSNDGDDHIALMPSGNIGINTIAPAGKLQIIHTSQDANGNAFILGPADASSLRLGYHTNYSWMQSYGNKPLSINPIGNNVGIGTTEPTAKLMVTASSEHLRLTRSRTETTGGKLLFLELFQEENSPVSVPEVFPSIRFHHASRYWHRIEARNDGIHIKTGALNADTYVPIFAENAIVRGMIIMWFRGTQEIPPGWALCNGANGTPDLRDRFVMGDARNFANLNDRLGGEISHSHNTGGPSGTSSVLRDIAAAGQKHSNVAAGNHGHGTGTNSHLPPFFRLVFIMKL
ncbi:phage tail protein [Myxacorys almedinensis]|uniref:Uncharacterized protein n=1 Tax=Myxacorys almedinensis A TaxID=2690445 RepID=A0A8J8CLT6_9CYAN|nr:phage tail protein [Myxacorys almedinensis]NDJ16457.1 hypothetical protein [Myxacorys almedinensis A]